jgi:hypothetical protein
VYPEHKPTQGPDGLFTCVSRTSFPITLDQAIYVSAEEDYNYAAATVLDGVHMQKALVQYLQADALLVKKYPDIASCGTGLVQARPTAFVAIAAFEAASTVGSADSITTDFASADPASSQDCDRHDLSGVGTKASGNILKPTPPNVYVEPTLQKIPQAVTSMPVVPSTSTAASQPVTLQPEVTSSLPDSVVDPTTALTSTAAVPVPGVSVDSPDMPTDSQDTLTAITGATSGSPDGLSVTTSANSEPTSTTASTSTGGAAPIGKLSGEVLLLSFVILVII